MFYYKNNKLYCWHICEIDDNIDILYIRGYFGKIIIMIKDDKDEKDHKNKKNNKNDKAIQY